MNRLLPPKSTKRIRFVWRSLVLAGLSLVSMARAQAPPTAPVPVEPRVPEPPGLAARDGLKERIIAYLAATPEIQCDYTAQWQAGDRVWVACGAHGLLELRRTGEGFQVAGQRALGGQVDGFFAVGGQVWVTLLERRAVVLSAELPSAGTSQSPAGSPVRAEPRPPSYPQSVPPPTPDSAAQAAVERLVQAKVVKVSELDVLINAGSADGLALRDRLALYTSGSLVAGGEGDSARGRVVVGRIVELWEESARVRVGVNEVVPLGADARLTTELPTASRIGPPKVPDVWELRVMGRPFFSVGRVGGGILTEGSLARRTESWHYGFRLDPSGVAGQSGGGSLTPWAGYLFGEFDSRLFAAGLGVGAQAVNVTDVEPGSGLSIVQSLRLGSIDGLHVSGRTTFVVFRSETSFSSFSMQGQLSVGESSWLIGRGGGGTAGYGFGEVALRTLLSGQGGADSLFLEVAVGGATFYAESCDVSTDGRFTGFPCDEQLIAGPMAGLGAEWRM